MYAVILSGGKQYRVKPGEILDVESLNHEVGETISFDKILLVGEGTELKLGKPYLNGATVSATVLEHGRGDKIHIIKFRRRKHHEKWQGHRQNYTRVKIVSIQAA